MTSEFSMEEWIDYGLDMGFAETFCYMHDSAPMENWEAKDYEEGSDPCIPTLRVWLDREQPVVQDPNVEQPSLFQ